MELTIEQKQRRSATQKQWRENNPDRVKELNNQYKNANKEKLKEYHADYYKLNKEHIRENQKEYRDNNIYLDAVYFFLTPENKPIYIGSSSRLKERLSAHLTNNSNLELTIEQLVNDYSLKKIVYKDFTEYNLSRNELYFIEDYYKQISKEVLGKIRAFKDEEKLDRSKEELIEIANQVEFKEFEKLDRYLN